MKGYVKPYISADAFRLALGASRALLCPEIYAKPPRPERPWEAERAARMRPAVTAEPVLTRQQARKLARRLGRNRVSPSRSDPSRQGGIAEGRCRGGTR